MEAYVCPACGGPVSAEGEALACRCGRRYPVVDGIPDFTGVSAQAPETGEGWARQWSIWNEVEFVAEIAREELAAYGWAKGSGALAGKTCLDVGCGAGRWTLGLLEAGAPLVYATDFSGAVGEARRNLSSYGDRVRYARADAARLPFPPGRFDVITASEMVQHTVDPAATTRHLAERLAPGGVMTWALYPSPERLLGRVKVRLMNAVRAVLSALPPEATVRFTRLSAPLYRSRLGRPLFRLVFIKADYDDRDEHIVCLNHDVYVRGHHYDYTPTERDRILEEAGLEVAATWDRIPNHFLVRSVRRR